MFFNHVHAADVTGGDVLVDGTPAHPIPAAPVAGGAITNASDSGNVYGNTLRLTGINFINRTGYGGYTIGSGHATGNTVILKTQTSGAWGQHAYIYGGWADQGNAINNTVELSGLGDSYYKIELSNGGISVLREQQTGCPALRGQSV